MECFDTSRFFFRAKPAKIVFTHVYPIGWFLLGFDSSVPRVKNPSEDHGLFPFCIFVNISQFILPLPPPGCCARAARTACLWLIGTSELPPLSKSYSTALLAPSPLLLSGPSESLSPASPSPAVTPTAAPAAIPALPPPLVSRLALRFFAPPPCPHSCSFCLAAIFHHCCSA
jgi:hypothetical protein